MKCIIGTQYKKNYPLAIAFGLTLTFEPANQEKYLEIVRHLASLAKLKISLEDLEFRAKQWATQHNGRIGRTA
jgi:predicted AAA+ superfamily ATPase